MNLAFADLFAGDLDDHFGAAALQVSDLGLAFGLGHLGLGCEHLFLPFEFFLLDVLGLLLVDLNLDVQGSGHCLRKRLGGWTEALFDHSLVVVLLVVAVMVSLVVMDLVVTMVVLLMVMTVELVMMDMMMMLMAVASVVDVDLDVPVMLLMVVMVMAHMMMVFMTLSLVAVMLLRMLVVMTMTSFMMMSARAPVFVLSVELLVVLLKTPHEAPLVDVVFVCVSDPLLDLGQAAVERSLLSHDEVGGALG